MSIIAESSSRYRISTITEINIDPINVNTSYTPSAQPPVQPSPTHSQFRRVQNMINNCRTWKFDKVNSSNHLFYIYLKQQLQW